MKIIFMKRKKNDMLWVTYMYLYENWTTVLSEINVNKKLKYSTRRKQMTCFWNFYVCRFMINVCSNHSWFTVFFAPVQSYWISRTQKIFKENIKKHTSISDVKFIFVIHNSYVFHFIEKAKKVFFNQHNILIYSLIYSHID